MDIVKDPKQEIESRDAIRLFCQQEQNAFQSLLVDTSLSPESKEAVNYINGKGYDARLCTSVLRTIWIERVATKRHGAHCPAKIDFN